MTTIHFPLDLPLRETLPNTVTWKRAQPLRLDGHALEGAPPEDRRLRYAPVSIAIHGAILIAFTLGPLLADFTPPEPAIGVRAFFAEPAAVLPPPPPPPPAGMRPASQTRTPPPVTSAATFVAPVEIPDQIARPSIALGGVGVAGGVEGGVEGGVVGGIVGGLTTDLAPPPKPEAQVVRVGGEIREPKRLLFVPPDYPLIASQAGVTGLVILEARVGTDGRVKDAIVLRGQPLFDEPARAAVMQWRYQPLLLNGIPMEFILTVTVRFSLRPPE